MPVDGVGSDAGRQSLTGVGSGARARKGARCVMCGARSAPDARRCAHCGAFLAATARGQSSAGRRAGSGTAPVQASPDAGANAASSPMSHGHPIAAMTSTFPTFARPTAASLPGERLVALSALGVLAIATVFFVERLGMLSTARDLALQTLAPFNVQSPDVLAPRVAESRAGRDESLPVQESEVASSKDETRTTSRARPRATVATVRKPEGKAEARSRLAGSVPSSAAYTVAGASPASAFVRTRWDRLREEVAWCGQQQSFFDAVLCEQRARQRWCEDWWGRASECPSGRQVDYGN